MATPRKTLTPDHPVVVTFLIIAIVASMSLAAEVLKPLALSVLLSFALAPFVGKLEKWGVPRAAAVVLTVVVSLGSLGGIGYVVGQQLTALANRLPDYRENILRKVTVLKPSQENALNRASLVASEVASSLVEPPIGETEAVKVRVVDQPTFRQRLQAAVGPYLEFLGVGSFVLILVLFMLMGRDDLSDRIIQLFGQRRISLTTRTMEEVGQRISRYLGMFALVNGGFGLVVGLGLWVIGVPYAVLWGFLAAALRFIPYVGPAVAFVLPVVFSVAHFPGWMQPLEVIALFAVVETILNSFLEPVIYGRTTGVSALGLLVAAMFWTWLWGVLGLLLSTPMTVCLAVLGKYVPSLHFFATLLGEESEMEQDVRYYQRLLALDQDGAAEVVESALKQQPRSEVFDTILIPALVRAERDYAREEIDDREQAFIWRVTADILDDLEQAEGAAPPLVAPLADGGKSSPEAAGVEPALKVVGVAANDTADALALRMLDQLLGASGLRMEIVTDASSPLKVSEAVAEHEADLVVLSHLPPVGLTFARYQVRRLRARFEAMPILVGRWGEAGDAAGAADRLTSVGASHVVFTLADARERILAMATPKPAAPASPALTPSGAGA